MKTFEFTEQEAELLRKEQYKYLINDNIDHFLLLVQQIVSERITPEPGESGRSAEAYVKCTCTNGLEYSNCAKNCGHGQEPEPGQSAEDESQADYIKFMWDNGIGYGSFVTLDEYRHCMKTIKDYASQVCADKDREISLLKKELDRAKEEIEKSHMDKIYSIHDLKSELSAANESLTVMLRKNAELLELVRPEVVVPSEKDSWFAYGKAWNDCIESIKSLNPTISFTELNHEK